MKWYLVSEDDLNEVRTILKEAIERVNYSRPYRDALHTLETGMHETDAVPADFAESRADTGTDDPALGPFTEPRGPGGDG